MIFIMGTTQSRKQNILGAVNAGVIVGVQEGVKEVTKQVVKKAAVEASKRIGAYVGVNTYQCCKIFKEYQPIMEKTIDTEMNDERKIKDMIFNQTDETTNIQTGIRKDRNRKKYSN